MLVAIYAAVTLNLFALAASPVTATDVNQIRYIFFDIPGTDGSADAFIAGNACPEPMLPDNKQGTAVDRQNAANSIQMYSYTTYGRQCTSYYAPGRGDWFKCVDPETQVEDQINFTFVPIEYGAPYACPDNCEETCNKLSPTGNWVENARIIRLIEWSIAAPAKMVRRSRRAKANIN